ncbi:hypothetical protein GCM10023322_23750 [Rugosimonospora acidiphila]|uniref:DMT family transporter n=1 Tax=Rugosimonospora acidiphila TaxID=556531 RepID=A0ABP9RRQ8_9ACTN
MRPLGPVSTRPSHRPRVGHRVAGCGLAAIGGATQAVRSRLNGEFGSRLHDGVATAGVTFAVGLAVTGGLITSRPGARRASARVRDGLRGGALRPWQCLGGLGGALLVSAQSITVAALGVTVFSVAVVAGQTLSSLLVDRLGTGPTPPQPLTAPRAVGAALAIAAVLVAAGGRLYDGSVVGPTVLSAVAGLSVAWQQGFNGRVRATSDSALATTGVNFAIGTAALMVAVAVDIGVRGLPAGTLPSQPWLYPPGVIGAFYIGVSAMVVRYTGVLLLGLSLTSGQMVSALILDSVAPEPGSTVGATLVIGIALALLAIFIASSRVPHPWPRRERAAGAAGQ